MPWWRKSAKYSSAASPSPRSSRRRRAAPDTVTLSSPIGLKIPATRFPPFSCVNLGRQSGASFLTFPIVYDLAASDKSKTLGGSRKKLESHRQMCYNIYL